LTRRTGLGRGLDALLPTSESEDGSESKLRDVDVSSIRPNPRQPRTSFDEGSLDELASSIEQLGVLQPLLAREVTSGEYELVAGERRLRAARKAELAEVPVLLVEADDRGSMQRALVENVHREDLNPMEEAEAYRVLLEASAATHDDLARSVGKSRAAITNSLRLLELPLEVQRFLVDGRLSAGHGRALLGLQGNPFQLRLAKRVAQEGLSVRETEELVRKYGSMTAASRRQANGSPERPAAVTEAQRRLADALQTRVRVDMGTRKGKIVVDFVSLEELSRLMDLLLGSNEGARRISLD
jgi:ParB family transcriptional regulator, chromosome partitioning protein